MFIAITRSIFILQELDVLLYIDIGLCIDTLHCRIILSSGTYRMMWLKFMMHNYMRHW